MREDERLLLGLYNVLSPEWQEEFWWRYAMLFREREVSVSPPNSGPSPIVLVPERQTGGAGRKR
jgi:hypothetical protein